MTRIEQPRQRMSLDDYLAWEESTPVKHEYIAGEVYAMSGVTGRHNLITLNLVGALRPTARPRGCRVFATDVKLRAAADRIYYPDVVLACGATADVDLIIDAPSMVVEVTSPGTRATDRREKLDAYMRIPSLRVYLIVEQRRRHVLMYTRDPNVGWLRDEISGTGDVQLSFLDARLSLDAIYDDVPLPPLTVREDDELAEWGDDEPDE